MLLAQEKVPKSLLLCLCLQLRDDGNDGLPTLDRVVRELRMGNLDSGENLILL